MKSSYIKTKFNNIINITEIVTIHYYELDDVFNFVGEQHNFWELVYVDSGEVEITRDNEKIVLRQGDIIFHKPNEFHSVKSHNSKPNIVVISFTCKSSFMTYFEKLKMALNKNLKPFLYSIIAEADNTYIIPKNDTNLKQLVKKNTFNIGSEQLIKTYLEQLLILIGRTLKEKNSIDVFPAKESMETHLIAEIKQYIKSNVYHPIKIKDICKAFGYSKSYLSCLFKQQCSISLARYYNVCQIEEAKKLIREKRYNFTQISDILSFDNPQYFARVFKRITGLTPSQFKNSLNLINK